MEITATLLLVHFLFLEAQPEAPKRQFVAVASVISLATAEESLAPSSLHVGVGSYEVAPCLHFSRLERVSSLRLSSQLLL